MDKHKLYLQSKIVVEKTWNERRIKSIFKDKKNLVEFSVDIFWFKLFQEVPETQSIDGNNFGASPLPVVPGTNYSR